MAVTWDAQQGKYIVPENERRFETSPGFGLSGVEKVKAQMDAGMFNNTFDSNKMYASGQAPAKTTTSSTGASSAGKSSGGGGQIDSKSQAEKDAAAAYDKFKKSNGKSFDSTIDAYKNLIGWLPQEQSDLQGQVENLAGTQRSSIENALKAAIDRYGDYRGEVQTRQKATLQDLVDNTRNLFQAGNTYLGARGAGNSSATGMYGAALTQQANKERASVQNQASNEYNEINKSQEDTQSVAQQELDAVETWKASRVSEIVQQYQQLKRELTVAKASANDAKKAALAELDRSLFESAINNLNNIKAQAASYQSQVGSNINSQVENFRGDDATAALAKSYQVGDIVANGLQGINQATQQADGSYIGYSGNQVVRVDENGTILEVIDQAGSGTVGAN